MAMDLTTTTFHLPKPHPTTELCRLLYGRSYKLRHGWQGIRPSHSDSSKILETIGNQNIGKNAVPQEC
eukprot:3784550-Pyramimonas_sp.AAC.1